MTSDDIQIIMAILMFFATAFAAYTAWRGPLSAAELAEKLRQASDEVADKRRLKLRIFATLMQERAFLGSLDGVQALNLIDVVFSDSRPVRERWSELHLSFDQTKNIPQHVQEERLRALLVAMAADLGLADNLRNDDFGRIYYPNSLAEEDRLKQLQRQVALARLTQEQHPSSNTAPEQSIWPSRPE